MMIVPARFLGDELAADRTEPLLPPPLMPPGSVPQVGEGSYGLPLFESIPQRKERVIFRTLAQAQ